MTKLMHVKQNGESDLLKSSNQEFGQHKDKRRWGGCNGKARDQQSNIATHNHDLAAKSAQKISIFQSLS